MGKEVQYLIARGSAGGSRLSMYMSGNVRKWRVLYVRLGLLKNFTILRTLRWNLATRKNSTKLTSEAAFSTLKLPSVSMSKNSEYVPCPLPMMEKITIRVHSCTSAIGDVYLVNSQIMMKQVSMTRFKVFDR